MKKSMMILTVLGIAVLSLGLAGTAFADEPAPATPGRGFGRSGLGEPIQMNIQMDGALEEYLHSYLADALGIDEALLDDGNFQEIALELGYDLTEIREIVKQAHSEALAQALVDGVITQESFDWLSTRGFILMADGMATGMNGGMGRGMNAGVCDGTCLNDGIPFNGGGFQGQGYRGGK